MEKLEKVIEEKDAEIKSLRMILEKHSKDLADMKQKIEDNCDRMDLIDSCMEDYHMSHNYEAILPISVDPNEVEAEHNPLMREQLVLESFPPWSFHTPRRFLNLNVIVPF